MREFSMDFIILSVSKIKPNEIKLNEPQQQAHIPTMAQTHYIYCIYIHTYICIFVIVYEYVHACRGANSLTTPISISLVGVLHNSL